MSMLETNRLGELTEQLKDVIRGYHPTTKERFSEPSDLNDPEIVRIIALLLAELLTMKAEAGSVELKTAMTRSNNARFGKPNNHGTRWTRDDLNKLATLFLKGEEIIKLSDQFGRSVSAIIGKLREMEIITHEERDQLFKAYTAHFKSMIEKQTD